MCRYGCRYKLADEPGLSDVERLKARHTYKLVGSHASTAQVGESGGWGGSERDVGCVQWGQA